MNQVIFEAREDLLHPWKKSDTCRTSWAIVTLGPGFYRLPSLLNFSYDHTLTTSYVPGDLLLVKHVASGLRVRPTYDPRYV